MAFSCIYNLFIRQNYGVYNFTSLDAFLNGEPAYEYTRNYSLVDDITGDGSAAAAEFNAMQLGFYLQDEWTVNRRLTLTGGLRVDIPIITSDPEEDTYLNETALPEMIAAYPELDIDANAGQAPDGQIMLSPRIGFTYDHTGNGLNILRGGAGIFTSRIPFVWPGAMFSNNGLTQGQVEQDNIDPENGDVPFRPDFQNQYTNPNFSIPSGQVDLFTKDFKYPQVFRTNLAYDMVLPGGIDATFEGSYTKTLNNVIYYNINSNPNELFTWTGTPDNRRVFGSRNEEGELERQDIDDTYSAVYFVDNTSEGYAYTLTGSLAKNFTSGLKAMIAYSWNDAYAVNEGTSSQNSSQWRGQVSINGRNNPVYGRSDFAIGHRVLGTLSYAHMISEDGGDKITISLLYNGQSGNPYSYIIAGRNARNLNNEPGSTSRNRSLIYIPDEATDINLVDYTVGDNVVTAAEQWANLDAFIKDDPYLSENRGGYAEKNASFAPFSHVFDLAIRRDFAIQGTGQEHKFQISLDIANVGNLLNSNWGTVYSVPGDFSYYYLYQFEGYAEDGTTPQFTYRDDQTGLDDFDIAGLASRWSILLGLRYKFN